MGLVRAIAGWTAGALTLAAFIPYIRAILHGETTPNRASWFIWAFVCIITALTYKASGAQATIFVAYGYAATTVVVAALSIRYGEPGVSWLDWACMAGAVVSLVPWLIFRNAPAALYLCILVDFLAILPTLRKARLHPASEDRVAWTISTTAMGVNLLAVEDWSPHISAYPLYCFLAVGGITAVLYLRKAVVASPVPLAFSERSEETLYVADTGRTGRGVYTRCAFQSGELVFVMQGEKHHYISRTAADAHFYENWLGIEKDMFLDPAPPYLYVNHSCNPNLGIRGVLDFIALRNIAPGEQLTYDYSLTTDELPWTMACNCGAASCRVTIRSIQYLPEQVYQRYLPFVGGYFQKLYTETRTLLTTT